MKLVVNKYMWIWWVLVLALPVRAQFGVETDIPDPLKVTGVTIVPAEIKPGAMAEVKIDIVIEPGFHAYLDQYKLVKTHPDEVHLSEFQITPTVKFRDPLTKKEKVGTTGLVQMVSLLEVPANGISGDQVLKMDLTYQACTKDFCLFPRKLSVEGKFIVASDNMLTDALDKGFLYALMLVFIGGLLTSLTPCIFPMIPITLAVLGTTNGSGRSRLHGLSVSVTYVLGIAFTYSMLGVAAAKSGALFGSLLGHPIVVGAIAILFTAMGLSMLGLFEIKAPATIAQKLGGTRFEKGYFGAFGSGLIAGVVASPCVGPVLISVLAYVAQTQNTWIGFILLFTFALGMGQLFIILGTFQSFLQKLPKSGAWMITVKKLFGFVMIGMALYFLYPVIPKDWSNKILPTVKENTDFAKPEWHDYSDEMLKKAALEKRPVIIDFKAEWCLACKELEHYTFSTPEVLEFGKSFLWLTFDATKPSKEFEVLQKKYGIGGLPYVTFYSADGKWRRDLTLFGFEEAGPFLERMKKALPK